MMGVIHSHGSATEACGVLGWGSWIKRKDSGYFFHIYSNRKKRKKYHTKKLDVPSLGRLPVDAFLLLYYIFFFKVSNRKNKT